MKFLAMDMESCSGNNKDCSLCSFGYCLADENFNILDQADILVNPKPEKFSLGFKNGEPRVKLAYSEKTFRKAPRFYDVYDKIKALFKDDVLVIGFSIINDIAYLNNACDTYGLDRFEFKYVDVQMLYKLIKHNKNNSSLGSAIDEYKVDFVEHRSDEDARVTLLLLKNICKETNLSFGELIEKYKIFIGTNDKVGYRRTISKFQVEKEYEKKLSNKKKEILIKNFARTVKVNKNANENVFKNKRFYLNTNLMHKDYKIARSIILNLANCGAIFDSDPNECDIYIAKKNFNDYTLSKFQNSENRTKPLTIIYENDLEKSFGKIEKLELDDVEILVNHYTRKNTTRYILKENNNK